MKIKNIHKEPENEKYTVTRTLNTVIYHDTNSFPLPCIDNSIMDFPCMFFASQFQKAWIFNYKFHTPSKFLPKSPVNERKAVRQCLYKQFDRC